MMYYVAIPAIVIWSFLGILFYSNVRDQIPNRWKRHVARIVAGPLVWALCIFGYVIDSVIFVDDAYTAFVNWLKKP